MERKVQVAGFLENKIKRQICMNGQDFVFNKVLKDDFRQNILTDEEVKVKGIFHENTTWMKSEDLDAARMVRKPQPKILTLYEDGIKLEKDFTMEFSGRKYVVSEKENVKGLNIAFDISLEVVL